MVTEKEIGQMMSDLKDCGSPNAGNPEKLRAESIKILSVRTKKREPPKGLLSEKSIYQRYMGLREFLDDLCEDEAISGEYGEYLEAHDKIVACFPTPSKVRSGEYKFCTSEKREKFISPFLREEEVVIGDLEVKLVPAEITLAEQVEEHQICVGSLTPRGCRRSPTGYSSDGMRETFDDDGIYEYHDVLMFVATVITLPHLKKSRRTG